MSLISRRSFVMTASAGIFGAVLESQAQPAGSLPLIVSTWPFGKPANEAALRSWNEKKILLDAIEDGIKVTESDTTNRSVGLSGTPNAAGVVQLDACIMVGEGHRAGSVAALEGVKHPISAARLVMEKTKHVMLVGEGARLFALEQGLEMIESGASEKYKAWEKAHPRAVSPGSPKNHDTIALLMLTPDRHTAGGCSTSGLGGKLPGRVGDSPILGSGLYVDEEVGGAGATGVGENVMRYCASFQIVELMRQGRTPREACVEVIRRIARKDPKGFNLSINFVALNKDGKFGAAGTDEGFRYSVTTPGRSEVLKPEWVRASA